MTNQSRSRSLKHRNEMRQRLLASVRRNKRSRIEAARNSLKNNGLSYEGKRYRRSKRLRPCVLPLLFVLSLGILLFERYLGKLFHLEDFQDAYYERLGIEPWDLDVSPKLIISDRRSLENLTLASSEQRCSKGLRKIVNVYNQEFESKLGKKIPALVHQTANSRCLTRNFLRAAHSWAFKSWSYYFHDDEAVNRLLQSSLPEFPHLRLVYPCIKSSMPAKISLWRYLVLWIYGGIFVDLNLLPSSFNETTILRSDDAILFANPGGQTLSTEIIAISPHHPLMYHAIHKSILNILKLRNEKFVDPKMVIGDINLRDALNDFSSTSMKKQTAISTGSLNGFQERSIRIAGYIDGKEKYVSPVFLKKAGKQYEFAKMGMELNEGFFSIENCFRQNLEGIHTG